MMNTLVEIARLLLRESMKITNGSRKASSSNMDGGHSALGTSEKKPDKAERR